VRIMDIKVSIVVPVYKVEKYIHRCVKSILHQTYPNLEMILVDDGSPDNCGNIIDEYEKQDPRIKAVHKENGGLSDARNYGMRYVSGEFTLFVDSDDWIDPHMVERLVDIAVSTEADVVQSAFYYAYDDKLLYDARYYQKDDAPITLFNASLMYELVVNERVKNFAWGKLFKTSIIQHIPFTKGVLFEDVFWTHKVFHHVEKYIILHEPLYFYYQRNDSIVANYSPRNLDMLKGLKERHQFLAQYYPHLLHESWKMIVKQSLIHYYLLCRNHHHDKDRIHRKAIQQEMKQHYAEIKTAISDDKELLRQLHLFYVHPLFHLIYKTLQKVFRKLNFRQRETLVKVETGEAKRGFTL
jgi:glycosyltransferase involved in cell wall biosynthesis